MTKISYFSIYFICSLANTTSAMDTSSSESILIHDLPLEVKAHIFKCLGDTDLLNLRQTCSQFTCDTKISDDIYPNAFRRIDLVNKKLSARFNDLTNIVLNHSCHWKPLLENNDHNNAISKDIESRELFKFYSNTFCELGKMYYAGLRTTPHYNKAFICFDRAAKLGNEEANFMAATILHYGLGSSSNHRKALTYYDQCTDKFCAQSLKEKAQIYWSGTGNVGQLQAHGWYLIRLAADKGDAESCYLLGCLPRPKEKRTINLCYLIKAKELGHPLAHAKIEELNELMRFKAD